MYSKVVPYTNFAGKPQNRKVSFNLTAPEIFKLLEEFQNVFHWYEEFKAGGERELETEEVISFYNSFEAILLAAWGVPSEDGEHFRKAGKYEFEESALFPATMMMFITDPGETGRFLDALMPDDLQELVKTADANLVKISEDEGTTPEQLDTVNMLRLQLAEAEAQARVAGQ